jgi:hypothetical protein
VSEDAAINKVKQALRRKEAQVPSDLAEGNETGMEDAPSDQTSLNEASSLSPVQFMPGLPVASQQAHLHKPSQFNGDQLNILWLQRVQQGGIHMTAAQNPQQAVRNSALLHAERMSRSAFASSQLERENQLLRLALSASLGTRASVNAANDITLQSALYASRYPQGSLANSAYQSSNYGVASASGMQQFDQLPPFHALQLPPAALSTAVTGLSSELQEKLSPNNSIRSSTSSSNSGNESNDDKANKGRKTKKARRTL